MGKLAIKGGVPVRKKPFPAWPIYSNREIEEFIDVLKSRKWNRWEGTKVIEFEDRFARYNSTRYGIAVANGTAALEISLKAGGVGPGDEVIVPAYTFIATATAVLQMNAIPVFVDIEPDTFCLNPDLIEGLITSKTKAIIPVHLTGYPADMDKIMKIAMKNNLLVVEDACQAHGAEWRGKKVGSIGDMGCFSFQASKNITCGEGGMIITDDEDLAKKCYSYHHVGRVQGRPFYEHEVLGWNYRMSEFQAALLLAQFERFEEQFEKREKNANYLTKKLREIQGIELPKDDPRVRRSYYIYMFKYKENQFAGGGISKEKFIKALRAEGIPCNSIATYIPLYKNPLFIKKNFVSKDSELFRFYYEKVDYTKIKCEEAERLYKEGIWFFHSLLLGEKEDIDDIIEAIKKIEKNKNELEDVKD